MRDNSSRTGCSPDSSMNVKVSPFLSASDSRPACSAFESNRSCSKRASRRGLAAACLRARRPSLPAPNRPMDDS